MWRRLLCAQCGRPLEGLLLLLPPLGPRCVVAVRLGQPACGCGKVKDVGGDGVEEDAVVRDDDDAVLSPPHVHLEHLRPAILDGVPEEGKDEIILNINY